jgi:hypothetical protein
MVRDIEMDQLPTVMKRDENHEQKPECRGWHDEHINGSDAKCLVSQEAAPGW